MSFTGDVTIGSNVQSAASIFDKEWTRRGYPPLPQPHILTRTISPCELRGHHHRGGTDKLNNDFLPAPPEYAVMPPQAVDAVSFENNHAMDMGQDNDEPSSALSQGTLRQRG